MASFLSFKFRLFWKCVISENIHTPHGGQQNSERMGGRGGSFQGGWGRFLRSMFYAFISK